MVALPTETAIESAIYALYEGRRQQPRPHLGGSEIGQGCGRRIWYSFRWARRDDTPGRVLRLFETGQREEERVIQNLRDIGMVVIDRDPRTGEQERYTEHGHYSGGIDGKVLGVPEAPKTWHLLEIKTHNAKSFADLKKHGVQKSKPAHYAQMQAYMRWSKLTRALYVAVCKDTDEIWAERIEYAPSEAKALSNRAEQIIGCAVPPEKLSSDPSYFECKFCPAQKICHEQKVAEVNCRTCIHSTPKPDGNWHCAKYDCNLPIEGQRSGCESHLHIPDLIPYAKPIGHEDGWVKYRMEDGREFYECAREGFPADSKRSHYSSKELAAIDPKAIGNEMVDMARDVLGGEVVG